MKTSWIPSIFLLFSTMLVAATAPAADGYDRVDAKRFAAKVLDAANLVGEVYIEEAPLGKLVDSAIRGLYDGLSQKLPKDLEDRLKNVEKESDLKTLIADARFHLGKNKALDEGRDLSLALNGMLRRLDPYCNFDPAPRFIGHPDWPSVGVGLQLGLVVADGLEVTTPLFESPAHRAGIRARDVITSVTSLDSEAGKPIEKPERISLKGKTPEQTARLLVGRAGSSVRVTVRRKGADKPISFDLVRAKVKPETVVGVRRRPDATWDHWLDADQKIGYIRIGALGEATGEELAALVGELEKNEAKGLILDLRFCPGGLLRTAVQVADLFIDDQVIVTIRRRAGETESYSGKREGTCKDLPLVCLVNEETASSAEVVAACLQDHRRAVIVGARSFGKGSIQNIMNFEGGRLKLTTATFHRPNGQTINRAGVVPEKGELVELKEDERGNLLAHLRGQEIIPAREEKFTDRQLARACEVLEKGGKK